MKITTLKTLIKDVFDKTNDIEEMKKSVLELLTIYEMDNLPEPKFIKDRYDHNIPDKVQYHTICGCKDRQDYYNQGAQDCKNAFEKIISDVTGNINNV